MSNLPSNWQVKSLGEVAKVKSGFAFKSEEYLNQGVPLVRIGNLNGSSLEFGNETVFVEEKFLTTCREFSLKENDVLIAMSGATTGKLALVQQKDLPCLLNQRVGLISIRSEDVLNAKYLFYYLAKGDLRREVLKIAGGSAQPNISPTQIMSFQIPLPPLPIQKQIAEILEKADQAKQKRKEANKLTDEFLQSVFIEMFGDPVKNPKGWERKKILNLILKIENENPSSFPEKEYEYIDISSINNISKTIAETRKITGQNAPSRARQLVLRNDILVSTVRPNLNTVALIKENYSNPIASTGFCILRTNFKYAIPEYLFQIVKQTFFVERLSRIAKGASYPAVTDGQITEIEISVPPLSLQQQFAEIVNKTEALKEKQKQSEQELENLFQSLMQKAFKGELVGTQPPAPSLTKRRGV